MVNVFKLNNSLKLRGVEPVNIIGTRRLTALIVISILAVSVACTGGFAEEAKSDAQPQSEQNLITAAKAMRSSGRVQFNFKDLEIIQFIRFMSELLGENIVVDPNVKGTVSIVSPKTITVKEARQVMLSILEMNSLSLQAMGGYSKITPLSAGPTSRNDVVKGPQSVTPSEQLVVQIVPLDYVKPGYVVEPVKAGVPGINIMPLSNGGSVLITGKAVLLNRAANLIRALDAPDSIRSIKIIPLQYISAKLLEEHLNNIAKDTASKLASLIAIGDERSKKIILIGPSQALREADRLMAALDVPAKVGNFHIYKLNNADAKTVAEQLNQILAVAAKMQPDAKGVFPASVVPDLSTNSLVLTASEEQYAAIKGILAQLDTQPKQVLLRGLIAEVNLSKLNSAGIDWSVWGGDAGSNMLAGGAAQLGASGVPLEFMQWFRDMTKQDKVNYDSHGTAVTTSVTKGMGLIYAYIKMLNTLNAINILSMPRLMCTDNMPSALQVGQVIPMLKGKLSEVSNPSAVQSSYEYKDTGLILKVTPHIRSGNLVALEIEQSIEDVSSTPGSPTPETLKRLIKTNVIVGNNETIVLGGLIKEVERTLKNRVPGISYIPLIGNLFTSSERKREKIDLMVFLTPQIIESPEEATQATIDLTTGKTEFSEGERQQIIKNFEEFQRTNKKEGVTNRLINQRAPVSSDMAPTSGDSVQK